MKNGIGHFYNHWKESNKIFHEFSKKNQIDKELEIVVSKLILFHDINFEKLTEEQKLSIVKMFNKEELHILFDLKRADLLAQNPKFHKDMLSKYDNQQNELERYYNNNKENERYDDFIR